MARQLFNDETLATVLRGSGGSIRKAAEALGYSIQTMRYRVLRKPELRALWVPGRGGRPNSQAHLRVVSSEAIVSALDRADHLHGAAKLLGIQRNAIASRVNDEAIADAFVRNAQRAADAVHAERMARNAVRRSQISAHVAAQEAHRQILTEMRDAWILARDSWIVQARERGLTLLEAGRILGVTRERARQLEEAIGMPSRTAMRAAR
jgi:hypothetical protein